MEDGDRRLVRRIVAEASSPSRIEFTGQHGTQPGPCFLDPKDDGTIALITDSWPGTIQAPS